MNFEIELSNLLMGFVAILLTVTGYFLKQSLDSLKEVQKCQLDLAQRMAKIEGKCEANHSD